MAKGLRSKVKRRNRSFIRETLSRPITEKRTEEIALTLKESIIEKNGTTIIGLRSVLGNGDPSYKIDEDDEDNEDDDVEVAEKEEEKKPFLYGKTHEYSTVGNVNKDALSVAHKATKKSVKHASHPYMQRKEKFLAKKGKVAQKNPGKQLVWF